MKTQKKRIFAFFVVTTPTFGPRREWAPVLDRLIRRGSLAAAVGSERIHWAGGWDFSEAHFSSVEGRYASPVGNPRGTPQLLFYFPAEESKNPNPNPNPNQRSVALLRLVALSTPKAGGGGSASAGRKGEGMEEEEDRRAGGESSGGDCSSEDEGSDGYRRGGYHAVRVGDAFKQGAYVVQSKLGWGHFSTVWLAWDTLHSVRGFALVCLSFGSPTLGGICLVVIVAAAPAMVVAEVCGAEGAEERAALHGGGDG